MNNRAGECAYELPAAGQFERRQRWYVPASARVSTPRGMEAVHDDRLMSAALVAEVERLMQVGKLKVGEVRSAVIRPLDPLDLHW